MNYRNLLIPPLIFGSGIFLALHLLTRRAERTQFAEVVLPDYKRIPQERFERTLASDPSYRKLRSDRQAVIKEVSLAEWEESMNYAIWAMVHGIKPSETIYEGITREPLTHTELALLRKHGALREPRWPGYTTHAAENGIFILIPDSMSGQSDKLDE